MGKDGTYKPHGEDNPVTLSADMGYNGIIAQLQSGQAREVVSVTIPEGYTVEDIAKTLEENGVCAASDFYTSMREDEFDYDFLEGIPENGADESENRLYRMEGYLFPDTYEFYTGSSAKSVITKFLDNFESKISIETTNRPDEYKQLWSKMHSCMQERGVTLDQIITLASLIQAERREMTIWREFPVCCGTVWIILTASLGWNATPPGTTSTISFLSRIP